MKMRNNNLKPVLIFPAILIAMFICLNLFTPNRPTTEDFLKEHFDLGYTNFDVSGIVQEKYMSNSHNMPIVVIKNRDDKLLKFYFQTNDETFYNHVQIGDSVYSKRKSCKAKVFGKSKSRIFNFLED